MLLAAVHVECVCPVWEDQGSEVRMAHDSSLNHSDSKQQHNMVCDGVTLCFPLGTDGISGTLGRAAGEMKNSEENKQRRLLITTRGQCLASSK